MLWANMALHMAADPQALIARWHRRWRWTAF
jgi:malonyl-CoA O-methyltransferase